MAKRAYIGVGGVARKVKQPFVGVANVARKVKSGYIGVGGVVTFKNARKLKETVQQIPLERILLETDCPYMAPEPHRGTRNNSSYLSNVAEKIAELKGVSADEVERVTWQNACRLFDIG